MQRTAVIADSIPSSAQLLAATLVRHGVEVHVVEGGETAMTTAEKLLAPLIIVSTGLMGWEPEDFTRRAKTSQVLEMARLVLVYGTGEDIDIDRIESLGFSGFIPRPFTEAELMARLGSVMHEGFFTPPPEADADLMPTPMAIPVQVPPQTSQRDAADDPTDANPIVGDPTVSIRPMRSGASEDELTPLPVDALALLRRQVDEAEERLQHYTDEDLSVPLFQTVGASIDPRPLAVDDDATVISPGGAGGPRRRPAPWFDDLVLSAVDRRLAELLRPGAPLQIAIQATVRQTIRQAFEEQRAAAEAQQSVTQAASANQAGVPQGNGETD